MDTIKLRAVKRFDLDGRFITEKSPPFDLPKHIALQHVALGNCILDDGATRERAPLPEPPVDVATRPKRRGRKPRGE
jgi:hypothetical protein